MTNVNRENVQAWVDALRSGEYDQAKEVLHTSDGSYCCLGVACEISGLGDWDGEYYKIADEERWSGVLPPAVQKWLGLGIRSSNPMLRGNTTAVTLNDDFDLTFAEIADLVEKKYLGVTR